MKVSKNYFDLLFLLCILYSNFFLEFRTTGNMDNPDNIRVFDESNNDILEGENSLCLVM